MLISFIAEVCISLVAFVWIIAMLGFADELQRSKKANLLGKLVVMVCIAVAISPTVVTLYEGWNYYFSESFSKVPAGLWLPVLSIAVCIPVCALLIFLYRKSYN